jgi:hypothetical protein
MQDFRAVILTFPRTGSSSLTRIIGRINNVEIIVEPFNLSDKEKRNKGALNFLYDSMSMPNTLDFLFGKYDIIQHEFRNVRTAWNIEMLHYLKDNKIPTILLYRENYLKLNKSLIISNTIKEWEKINQPINLSST